MKTVQVTPTPQSEPTVGQQPQVDPPEVPIIDPPGESADKPMTPAEAGAALGAGLARELHKRGLLNPVDPTGSTAIESLRNREAQRADDVSRIIQVFARLDDEPLRGLADALESLSEGEPDAEPAEEADSTGNATLDELLAEMGDDSYALLVVYTDLATRNCSLADTVLAFARSRTEKYAGGKMLIKLVHGEIEEPDASRTAAWFAFLEGAKATESLS